MIEEEFFNQQNKWKYVEIIHNINNDQCEISVQAFISLSSSQTLNIAGYIKKQNILVLINSRNTHNFIDKNLGERINCFMYSVTIFQVLVINGEVLIVEGNDIRLNLVRNTMIYQVPCMSFPLE